MRSRSSLDAYNAVPISRLSGSKARPRYTSARHDPHLITPPYDFHLRYHSATFYLSLSQIQISRILSVHDYIRLVFYRSTCLQYVRGKCFTENISVQKRNNIIHFSINIKCHVLLASSISPIQAQTENRLASTPTFK